MSNRRKTRESRLTQMVRNNPKKRQKAKEELSKIDLFRQFATLDSLKTKGN